MTEFEIKCNEIQGRYDWLQERYHSVELCEYLANSEEDSERQLLLLDRVAVAYSSCTILMHQIAELSGILVEQMKRNAYDASCFLGYDILDLSAKDLDKKYFNCDK